MTKINQNDLIENGLDTSLSEEGVRALLMKIEHDNILSKYTFPTKPDSHGYYRVYVKDPSMPNGRKQFRDKNLENLKERVYDFERCILNTDVIVTFEDAFEYSQNFEQSNVSKERQLSKNNTISRNRSEFARFFSGSKFACKPIADITVRDIDLEIRSILKRLSLSQKGLESIRCILNTTFKRALYAGWIDFNPAERIIWTDYKKLLVAPTSIAERAYTDEELQRMRDYITTKHQSDPSYIPAYALEFQMIVGMRRGEIAPLRWDDVDMVNRTIYVHQELVSPKGKSVNDECICNYTKNGKARYYPIATIEEEFLHRLKDVHDKYYPASPYLFPAATANGCITNNMVYQFFRRMCRKIGITISKDCIRGTHALRRNAITEVVNNSNGNCILAAQMFGNSPETIRKHYYVGEDLNELRSILDMRNQPQTTSDVWSSKNAVWSSTFSV